jgi:hypothetical protein
MFPNTVAVVIQTKLTVIVSSVRFSDTSRSRAIILKSVIQTCFIGCGPQNLIEALRKLIEALRELIEALRELVAVLKN